MAGNLRQIQLQAKSIKNIQKLTNSMKMVAATRFKQAERLLVAARPLGVGARKFYDLVGQEIEPKSKIHYLVPFTSDRGLCGSCHFKTCKATTTRMQDGRHEYRVICVGEKAKLIIGFKVAQVITLVVNGIGHRNPTFKGASQIATRILNSDVFHEGTLYYSHFASAMSYDIKHVKIYSAQVLRGSKFVDQYETDSGEEIDMFVEFSLATLIFYAMTETYGVELFSRMNAMAAASKNAGALHQKLSQSFNRARQNLITRDLIDIVSGASVVAIKKKPKSKVPGAGSTGRPPSSGNGHSSRDIPETASSTGTNP